jgi:hypothetical protein
MTNDMTIAEAVSRKRMRLKDMAASFPVSERKFREWVAMGLPHTRIGNVLLFEPSEVHAWLDRFRRVSTTPGVKRVRGMKVPKIEPEFAAK